MLRLRSPELGRIRGVARFSWRRVGRRWAIVLAAVVLLAGLAALIRWRAVDAQGAFGWIYALHDSVYLPLKGYLVVWGSPWSLAVWGAAAAGAALALAGFLAGRSLLRGAHIAVLRPMLRRPSWHPILLRRHAGSRLLWEACRGELQLARAEALRESGPQRESAASLALLLAELSSAFGKRESRAALEEWIETFTALRTLGLDTDPLRPAFHRFAPQRISESDDPFALSNILLDIRDAAGPTEGLPAREARLPEDSRRRLLRRRLANSVAERRAVLEAELERLELSRRHDRPAVMARRSARFTSPVEELPLIGRLSTTLALLSAHLNQEPEQGLAWLELLEALHLALPLEADSSRESGLPALIGDVPRPEDFRLAAILNGRRLRRREDELSSSALVFDSDLALARSRIETLELAAGRDFQPAREEAP